MRLLSLETENVKRTKLVRFKPRAGVNVVRGKNKQGKTSLLDSIEYLFGGSKTHPPKVIREGETEAHVVAETEEFVALRRWWKTDAGEEKTELEVRSKGDKLKSPQAILDKLFSGTFSATAFQELKADKQLEVLRKITGVNTAEIDASYQRLFAARTIINGELKAARARLDGVAIKEAPPPKVDVTALLKRQGEITHAQQWDRQVRAERDAAARRVTDAEEHVKVCEQALAQAKAKLEAARKIHGEADNAVDELPTQDGLVAELRSIQDKMVDAQGIAAAHERWESKLKLEKEIAELEGKSASHDTMLEGLKEKKTAMIAAAKFPVSGLGFADDGVTFDGGEGPLPLVQASGAEQLAVSVAIGIALNPKIRVMLVRNGSFLDEDSLAALEVLCDKHDMQCFVEMVGQDGPASLLIVDGEVVSRSES